MGRTMLARCVRSIVGCACSMVLIGALAGTAHARPVIIRGIGVRWSPTTVSVSRGTLVKWRGVSNFHDLRAYGRNWSLDVQLPVGVTVQRRFRSTGTFLFRCTYHSTLIGNRCSGMCGSVVVTT
jgi:plastocyanin